MNSFEIRDTIRKVPGTNRFFVGVYSSDNMPRLDPPFCFVVNTDPSFKSGSHWCAFFVTENQYEFFDSYGRSVLNATLPLEFAQYTKDRTCMCNNLFLEGILSKTCGQFCIYFIVLRCLGISYDSILKTFSRNRIVNDKIVNGFTSLWT